MYVYTYIHIYIYTYYILYMLKYLNSILYTEKLYTILITYTIYASVTWLPPSPSRLVSVRSRLCYDIM